MHRNCSFQSQLGWSLCLFVVAFLGCSKVAKLNPVEGKVVFKDAPLPGALVTFHPVDAGNVNVDRPVGLTKDDGTFKLSTGEVEGAAAGKYKITVICSEIPKSTSSGFSTGGLEAEDRLKGAYAVAKSSMIEADVKDGPNQLNPFVLK